MTVAIKRYPMGRYILSTTTQNTRYRAEFQRIRAFTRKPKRKNMFYRESLTKYRQEQQRKRTLVILIVMTLILLSNIAITQVNSLANRTFHINNSGAVSAAPYVIRDVTAEKSDFSASLPVNTVRKITMYNAGDPLQCDNTPCISASGDNICNLLAKGKNICAANFVPLGTMLEIEGLGTCEVLDRMNSRYPENVDWAMEAHQKQEAINFGVKKLKTIIN